MYRISEAFRRWVMESVAGRVNNVSDAGRVDNAFRRDVNNTFRRRTTEAYICYLKSKRSPQTTGPASGFPAAFRQRTIEAVT